jgi:hypothetical protein
MTSQRLQSSCRGIHLVAWPIPEVSEFDSSTLSKHASPDNGPTPGDLGDPPLQRSPILGGRVMTPGGRSDMGGPIGPTGHPGDPRSGITGQCQPS